MTTPADLAAALKLHRSQRSHRSRDEWRGSCPQCGYADAFVLGIGKRGPVGWCASCQDRGGIAALIAGYTGGSPVAQPDPGEARRKEDARRQQQERALQLWAGAEPVPGTIAEVYLDRRHIGHIAACPDLRYRADCPHPARTRQPAMLALVRDAGGAPVGVSRTYLKQDGSAKADVEPARASLGPVWGGAVRLAPLAAELVVGEGIETAGAASVLIGLPAWAALFAGNLASGLVLPVGVRSVVIAADHDEPGRLAANAAWRRWKAEGRHVRISTPNKADTDFNDVLQARVAGGRS